jgi:hypothetical protein
MKPSKLPKSKPEVLSDFVEAHSKLNGQKFVIRNADRSEASQLIEVEASAWPVDQRATSATIMERLEANPETFFVIQDEMGKIIGFFSCVPLHAFDEKSSREWNHYAQLCKVKVIGKVAKTRVIYGVSLSVAEYAPRGTATLLLSGISELCRKRGIVKLAYGARIPGFHIAQKSGITIDEYFKNLCKGNVRESVVGAALGSGGRLVCPLRDYYEDPESLDYGILVVHEFASGS